MTQKKLNVAQSERTPLAQLTEAAIHPVLGYQLAQAGIVATQVFEERVGRAGGLHRVEFTILALVQGNPDVTARQLARVLAVTPANVAIWLDRLESRALVVRRRSESDARVQHIRISKAGSALVDRSVAQVLEGEQAALAVLSAAERALLIELLHKVALARR